MATWYSKAKVDTLLTAVTAQINSAVAGLVNSAPGALDTLGELAAALTADEGAAATLTTLVGTKQPLTRAVTVAYAATVTPNADTTDVLNIGALTGNLTLANPTGTPLDGQSLRVRFAQDATGSRTITFGAGYAFGSDITTLLVPTTALAKWVMQFTWVASDSKWRAVAIARGF